MSRPTKVQKTADEVRRNFQHVFRGLLISCESYDAGYKGEAARLAASVYILVHDYGRNSVSLLTQLGRNSIDFVNTCVPLNPKNLLTEMPLAMMHLTDGGMEYVPLLGGPPEPPKDLTLPFGRWWEMDVMRDDRRRTVSRRNIVFHMRHCEGGGHVDPKLDEIFADIQRANSMGWVFSTRNKDFVPEYGPEYATMRQIAWEVEQTLQTHCGDLIKVV